MNNAGVEDADILVILNDNDMSISPPVGALNKYLTRLLSGQTYNAARRAGAKVLELAPSLKEFAKRAEEHVKGMITPGTLFEEFGFHYYGPIDGHDLDALIPTLENLRELPGPKFLHVITKKGYGYKLAEADPILYHGVGKFDHHAGIQTAKGAGKLTYTQVFGDWLCDMAARSDRLVGDHAGHARRLRPGAFRQRISEALFRCRYRRTACVTFAAGLACEGLKPVVAIYSTFLQRAYDQLIHDVVPAEFAGDFGSRPWRSGRRRRPTHHGTFDLSFVTCIPNMVVMAPADEAECRRMLSTAYTLDGPSMVRYPRGGGTGTVPEMNLDTLPVGKGEICRAGKGVALLAFGSMVAAALAAGEELDATVANMRFVKPLDIDLIVELAGNHSLLVSIEENAIIGGAGSEIERALAERGLKVPLLRLGLPDRFIDHGDQTRLLAEPGLDKDGILRTVREKRATTNKQTIIH
jgi:1-deoxy-D-xylulose-5-phosphate synthase